jgi:hypothetical protein
VTDNRLELELSPTKRLAVDLSKYIATANEGGGVTLYDPYAVGHTIFTREETVRLRDFLNEIIEGGGK